MPPESFNPEHENPKASSPEKRGETLDTQQRRERSEKIRAQEAGDQERQGLEDTTDQALRGLEADQSSSPIQKIRNHPGNQECLQNPHQIEQNEDGDIFANIEYQDWNDSQGGIYQADDTGLLKLVPNQTDYMPSDDGIVEEGNLAYFG